MKRGLIQVTATLLGVLLLIGLASCGTSNSTSNGASNAASATPNTSAPSTSTPPSNQYRGRGPMVSGTLTKIDGNILTLTTRQGTTTVNINSSTVFQKTITGALSDLQQGEFLFVMGSPDASGNISAISIQIQPQGSSQASPPTGGSRGTPNQQGTRTFGQRQGTMGTLTEIDGNILTLTTSQGTATVNVSSNTNIQETVTGTVSDLEEGQSLSVIGTSDSNGNITATSIRILPPGQNIPPGAPPAGA
jgi:hypothetical protein